MTIKFDDYDLTPNQIAKEILIDGMQHHKEFWLENFSVNVNEEFGNRMTEKQIKQVNDQIEKRMESVIKYLGGSPKVNIHIERIIKERKNNNEWWL